MDEDFRRRLPCVDRKVSEIGAGDIRVRVTGTVVDSAEGRAVVDDGTGKIAVNTGDAIAEAGKLVRVFGRVIPVEDGFELQGEVVQDFSGVDVKLLRRIEEAERAKNLKFQDDTIRAG
jgi:hypothetical protein